MYSINLWAAAMCLMTFNTTLRGEALSLAQTCALMGLSPEALTACGYSEAQTAFLLDRLAGAVTERQRASAAQTLLQQAIDQLNAIVHDMATTDSSEVELARQNVFAAQAALQFARESLWSCLVQDEPEARVALLEAWRDNEASSLPSEFRVVSWTAAERAMLEHAIVAERRSDVTGRAMEDLALSRWKVAPSV